MAALIPISVISDEALQELQHEHFQYSFLLSSVPVVLSFDGPAMLASFGTTSVNASVSISNFYKLPLA